MTPSVQLENVCFAYGRGHQVLANISFAVPQGTFLAVIGPNGVGKSTLISLIAGLLWPQSGTVLVDGVAVRSYRPADLARKIALVRQEYVPVFGFSVAEMVLMARTAYYGPLGFESEADRQHVTKALEMTGTTQFASRPLASLSGGERQRVFIARALAQDTPILLMDEPTSFLDLRQQVRVYDLLKTIQLNESRTVIAITQDVNLASQYCDQTLLLYPISHQATPTEQRQAAAEACRYRIGPTHELLTAEHIGEAFGVEVFSGHIGQSRFFIPLGDLTRDAIRGPKSRSEKQDWSTETPITS